VREAARRGLNMLARWKQFTDMQVLIEEQSKPSG
jgi:hypothetical protein